MNSRERVLMALDHEEPDRVPLFFGTSGATTILGPGYERLKAHLGLRGGPMQWFSASHQYVWPDERVLLCLGSDGRSVAVGPAESSLRKDISADCMVDDWGIMWRRSPTSLYFEMVEAPLRTATIDDLERYPWPDLTAAGAVRRGGPAGESDPGRRLRDRAVERNHPL